MGTEMKTKWEKVLKNQDPNNTQKVLDSWDEKTRDFIAFLRVKRIKLLKSHGPLAYQTKHVSGAITAWLDENRHPSLEPVEVVYKNFIQEYEKETNEIEKHEVPYKIPVDIISQVNRYYKANKGKKDRNYGENWLRVLIAFNNYQRIGLEKYPTKALKPFTAKEARDSLKKWDGWKPILEVLEELEALAKGEKVAPTVTTAEFIEFEADGIVDTRTEQKIKTTSLSDKVILDISYRLDTGRADGVRQISWLADLHNHDTESSSLIELPYNRETETRIIPFYQLNKVIYEGTRPDLPKDEYYEIRAPKRFTVPFRFQQDNAIEQAWEYHQKAIDDGSKAYLKDPVWLRFLKAVGATNARVTPITRNEAHYKATTEWNGWGGFYVAIGNYHASLETYEKLHGEYTLKEDEPIIFDEESFTQTVSVPDEMAVAIKANDWATVAQLAKQMAGE